MTGFDPTYATTLALGLLHFSVSLVVARFYLYGTCALSRTSGGNPRGSEVSRKSDVGLEAGERTPPVLMTQCVLLSFVHRVC